jgi:uncharacterized protein (DUF1697 family)
MDHGLLPGRVWRASARLSGLVMALVVFLRGVNVGGHKTFRPKGLAGQLAHLDVINIGAAGTFVIKKPVAEATLRQEIAKRLPFESRIAICKGRVITDLIERAPFGALPPQADVVRFISVFLRPPRSIPKTPLQWPETGRWLVRVLEVERGFVVGEYRRHMKTIRYLGGLDKVFGEVTTRNWNTVCSIARHCP